MFKRQSNHLEIIGCLLLLLIGSILAGPAPAESYVLNFDEQARSCVAHADSDWGYYGQVSNPRQNDRKPILLPLDWGRQFEDCGHMYAPMHRQSPIELPAIADEMPAKDNSEVVFGNYPQRDFVAENNCHTVQATPVPYSDQSQTSLIIDGVAYRLLQFHLHTPSEHVFDIGEHGTVNYPVEIHFVHAATADNGKIDGGRLAVVGLLLDIAHGDVLPERTIDTALATMALNLESTQSTPADGPNQSRLHVDLNKLLVSHTDELYHYRGSLTTPPCSEIVDWLVLSKPAVISKATYQLVQARKLDVGFANNRPPIVATRAHHLRYRGASLVGDK
ncbi:MAG: carbonic anhydrase family protein [Gammaproteobacteria bacterium]